MLCSLEFYYLKHPTLLFLLHMGQQYNIDVEDKQKKISISIYININNRGGDYITEL